MENSQTKKPEESAKTAAIAVVIFIALIYGCNQILCTSDATDNYSQEQKDSVKKAEFIKENKMNAYIMSQQFLNERLKSPGTADYPLDLDREFVTYIGDSIFHVQSYVDSQNGFGALIRTKYNATLKFTGGDNWKLLEINLDE